MKFSGLLLITVLLMIFAFVPVGMAQSTNSGSLLGTRWQLISYGAPGSETPVIAGSTITLEFMNESKMAGSGGCNSYSGIYRVEQTAIGFTNIVSTLRACADAAITQQEQTYLNALQSASSYVQTAVQLTIWYDNGRQQLNFVSVAQTGEQEPAYENLTSPVDLLASYYNAIKRQEYQRAYSYWDSPPNPYDEFSSGFADTLNVQVIVQPPTRIGVAAGSQYVEIPTVLIADHRDGTQHTFAGCFTTRKANLRPPDIPEEDVWHLYRASLVEVTSPTDVPTLLTQACETP